MDKKLASWLILLILILPSLAEARSNTNSNTLYPYSGRIEGTTALSNSMLFGVDGMLPIYGNRDGFLFGDLAGGYGTVNDSYVVSPGGGYRKVFDNHIWGAYLFADYQQPNPGGQFWDLSPGIEWMNSRWDAHANLYFPTTRKQSVGSPVYADTIGDYSQVSFSGHNQYDAFVAPYSVMGNGGDVEFGYSLAGYHGFRTRLYVGAYYYAPPNVSTSDVNSVSSIRGFTFGVQVPLNKIFTLAVANSNDNVNHNIAAISLSMTLGGNSSQFSPDIHDRLLDPIARHVGIIGTGAGAYAQKQYVYAGTSGVEYNNVYFISPDGTGDGSYGNAAALSQNTLDTINTGSSTGARIYIQGGSGADYTIDSSNINPADTLNGQHGLLVYGGQEFYGRNASYQAPASSAELPQINVDVTGESGTLSGFLAQTGNNIFSNLSLSAAGTTYESGTAAIYVYNDGSNQSLAVDNVVASGVFGNGIDINNTSTIFDLSLNNSNLSNLGDGHGHGSGMAIESGSAGVKTLVINNSTLSSDADGIFFSNSAGSMSLTINNSTLNNNALSALALEVGSISAGDTIDLTINSSSLNSNAGSTGYGLFFTDLSSVGAVETITLNNSTFNNNHNVGAFIETFGSGDIRVTSNHSMFNNNGMGIELENFASGGSLDLILNSSQLNNNLQYGFYDQDFAASLVSFELNNVEINSNYTNSTTAYGFLVDDFGAAIININAVSSQFNSNGSEATISGSGLGLVEEAAATGSISLSATSSQFNSNGNATGGNGLYVSNSTSNASSLIVSDLSGTSFNYNGQYGIFGSASNSDTTSINYSGATFSGNGTADTSQTTGDHIDWIDS